MSTAPATAPWQTGIRARQHELTAALRELAETMPPVPSPDLSHTLAATFERIDSALHDTPASPSVKEICRLLDLVCAAQAELRKSTLGVPFQVLSRVHDALARIRDKTTSTEIIRAAPAELCDACGFDRAMISRLQGSTWIPETLHIAGGVAQEADARLQEFIKDLRIPLASTLLEAELARRRIPALVLDAQNEARTYRPLIEVSGTRAYVAAPIVANGSVIGFLHADTHRSGRPLSESDRDNLQFFAEGFALIFEYTVLLERLALQRECIATAFSTTETMIDALYAAPVRLVRKEVPAMATVMTGSPRPARSLLAPRRNPVLDGLTPREREVLDLLASGATNGQIANRLTVSETTVKSHVKHILRKLRVSNRAEAISRYLRLLHGERRAS